LCVVDGQRPRLEFLLQRLAFDELHRDVERALVLVEAVDRADVRVVQRGEQLRFALETREAIAVPRERARQRFDGHVAAELGVARAVDLAHAARAKRTGDFVGAETGAGHQRHG
jgi:hypothetical protein